MTLLLLLICFAAVCISSYTLAPHDASIAAPTNTVSLSLGNRIGKLHASAWASINIGFLLRPPQRSKDLKLCRPLSRKASRMWRVPNCKPNRKRNQYLVHNMKQWIKELPRLLERTPNNKRPDSIHWHPSSHHKSCPWYLNQPEAIDFHGNQAKCECPLWGDADWAAFAPLRFPIGICSNIRRYGWNLEMKW